MNHETDTACKITRWRGESACSVAEFVAEQASENTPLLAWAEPEPTTLNINGATGRLKGFKPLVCGCPDWHDNLSLVEARLFWKTASLHVVAREGSGCKWAYLEETDDAPDKSTTRPDRRVGWFSRLLNRMCRRSTSPALHPQGSQLSILHHAKAGTQEVFRQSLRVLTITDLGRFGLTAAQFTAIDHLMAVAYWQRGRLVAWGLKILEENDHA